MTPRTRASEAWRSLALAAARLLWHGPIGVGLHGIRNQLIAAWAALQSLHTSTLARLGPRWERAAVVGIVVVLHLAFVAALIFGSIAMAPPAAEVSLVLVGGPVGAEHAAQKAPDLVQAKEPDVAPPILEIERPVAILETTQIVSGSPNVTRPAMAIASVHEFPKLPMEYASVGSLAVRLLLSIARDGTIARTEIAQSSGIAALDRYAADWVTAHWRYQPALQDGESIPTTTVAVVAFARS